MTHTQGPWTINGIDTILSASANRTVAKVYRPVDDARLIAAAPELLAMLEDWCSVLDDNIVCHIAPCSQAHLNLRAAIAKAKS